MFPPNPLNAIWHKLFRKDAPQTSIEAAQSIDPNPMEQAVLEVIKGYPSGCISDDVQDQMNTYAYSSVTARFSSLARKGLIEFTGEKRKGRSGRNQRIMRAI